jgi:hypothetical protein
MSEMLLSSDELEELAERLLQAANNKAVYEDNVATDLILAYGAVQECLALRMGIEQVIKTCTDMNAVVYLRDLLDITKN